jgi:hypothetical protein
MLMKTLSYPLCQRGLFKTEDGSSRLARARIYAAGFIPTWKLPDLRLSPATTSSARSFPSLWRPTSEAQCDFPLGELCRIPTAYKGNPLIPRQPSRGVSS